MSAIFKPVSTGYSFLFAFSLVSFIPSIASADDNTEENILPPVIVSATRTPTPANQVASSVTVITAQDIEQKQQRTLPDILQDVPGLTVVQTGGVGGLANVFIRGANPNHTKVLVDGIDISDPSSTDGSFDFSQVLASDIERVEVLRGPQSGLYGSDAIGGVINIITKKGSGPAQFTGSIEGGSFATFNQTAGVNGSQDRFNYNLDVAHYHTGDVQVTPTNLVPAGRALNEDSYDNKTFSTKLGATLTDNIDVGFVGRYVDTSQTSTSDDLIGPESIPLQTDNHEFFTRGTIHQSSFDNAFNQTLGVAYTDYRRRDLDNNIGNASLSDFDGDRIKTDWQGDIKLMKGEILTLGAEHQYDEVTSLTDAQMSNNAGDMQLQSSFGERLFNTTSIRYDDNSRFGGKATYREAPAFLITETDTKLKASAGTGFKAPTLDDLFHNYPDFGFFANPNLRPETSFGYDAGFEQNVLNKRVQFGSTYFHNNIKNLITFNDDFTSDINVGRATTYGLESFVSYKPLKTLTLRADHTFTIAKNDITDEELIRRPKNKASLNATWQVNDKLSLSGTALYTGSWVDINRSGSETDLMPGGYTILNLAGSYELLDGVSAFTRIENALDKHYQNPVGFERPGFGIYGGLKINFNAFGKSLD